MATLFSIEKDHDLYKPEETVNLDIFGANIKNAYLQRVEKFFEENSLMTAPKNVEDEFGIVIQESRILLSKDCAMGLRGLVNYLNKQKVHLNLIKMKLNANSYTYMELSTFVVKVAFFDIDETLFLRKLIFNKMNMQGYEQYSSDIETVIWDTVKILDNFDMLFIYKKDRYTPKRHEYEQMCQRKWVDTRSGVQKYKDTVSDIGDSFSGCILVIVIILICMLIYAIIK